MSRVSNDDDDYNIASNDIASRLLPVETLITSI